MIALDTSVLVGCFTGPRPLASALRRVLDGGELLAVPAIVLYEWLRGPRLPTELADQEAILPAEQSLRFGPREAAASAQLYRSVPRARGREFDLAIAACALTHQAALWTLNASDFRDIPGLRLFSPR